MLELATPWLVMMASAVLGLQLQEGGDGGAADGLSFKLIPLPSPPEEVRKLRAQQRAKHRKLGDKDMPLGIGTGTHYVNAYIGTPPQRASIIVDTGSAKMALPCKGNRHSLYQLH